MKLILLLSVFVVVSAFAANFKAPLKRHLRRFVNKSTTRNHFNRLDNKKQSLFGYWDELYVINITLGTPDQVFQVVLDTSFSNLWVVDDSCTNFVCDGIANSTFVWHKHKYHRDNSSTFLNKDKPFEISHIVYGNQFIDTFKVAGMTVENLTFVGAYDIVYYFGEEPIDGFFGLGWPQHAIGGIIPPFQKLIPQLSQPIFTLWFDRHIKPSEGLAEGAVTFGSVDKENCDVDNMFYMPISRGGYWQIAFDSFEYGKYKKVDTTQVLLDSFDSFIYGPPWEVEQIATQAGAQFDLAYPFYTIDCESVKSLPDLVFNTNNNRLAIPAKEYVVDFELPDGQCAFGITGIDGIGYNWSAGSPFLRTFCTTYDFGQSRLGFAKAHHKDI